MALRLSSGAPDRLKNVPSLLVFNLGPDMVPGSSRDAPLCVQRSTGCTGRDLLSRAGALGLETAELSCVSTGAVT